MEGDSSFSSVFSLSITPFLSTPSGWRATAISRSPSYPLFISIHALRVEGDNKDIVDANNAQLISIHALRVEGDQRHDQSTGSGCDISIHALRVEGDGCKRLKMAKSCYFYPRPPGGGRPSLWMRCKTQQKDFYPRPPGGGRLDNDARFPVAGHISIHALRVEGDRGSQGRRGRKAEFLSTPSGWRATLCFWSEQLPRPRFLSTPSGWRATKLGVSFAVHRPISIHALRVEGDHHRADYRRVRPDISIHALRVEGDAKTLPFSRDVAISIHALRVEGDWREGGDVRGYAISIHALRVEGDP